MIFIEEFNCAASVNVCIATFLFDDATFLIDHDLRMGAALGPRRTFVIERIGGACNRSGREDCLALE
jgi:hypothetical protein